MATLLDNGSVLPNGVGRFTFGLRGSPPVGSYTESFNLQAQGVRWFDYRRLGSYYIPIVISNLTE
jgi:hypothetical protein